MINKKIFLVFTNNKQCNDEGQDCKNGGGDDNKIIFWSLLVWWASSVFLSRYQQVVNKRNEYCTSLLLVSRMIFTMKSFIHVITLILVYFVISA